MSGDPAGGEGAAPAPGRAGLLDAVREAAAGLGRICGLPILEKEIRADFRKNRFFITHLVCLGIMAAGVLWSVALEADKSDAQPERVGTQIFNTFFQIQYLVVLVVFPAFSANSLSEERSGLTFDLLITTDLRPEEIIAGKFLASSLYCLIYIVATVPLLSVSLLFAGVTLGDIFLAYSILIGLTLLLSMGGVFISSCTTSSIRSTLILYSVSAGILGYSWFHGQDLVGMKEATTITSVLTTRLSSLAAPGLIGATLAIIGHGWAILLVFAFLFLLASNRIRPRAADSSSKLRILTFIAIVGVLGVEALKPRWQALSSAPATTSTAATTSTLATLAPQAIQEQLQDLFVYLSAALLAVAMVFPAETADVPRRLRHRFRRWRGPLRIFVPGSFTGLLYTTVLGVLTGCLYFALSQPAGGAAPGAAGPGPGLGGAGAPLAQYLPFGALHLLAFASLAFYLSTMDFTPLYTRLTVSFIFVIALLLPVIFKVAERPGGILAFYYLSPITVWESLHPDRTAEAEALARHLVLGLPVATVGAAIHGTAAAVFTTLGIVRSKKKGYPLWRG